MKESTVKTGKERMTAVRNDNDEEDSWEEEEEYGTGRTLYTTAILFQEIGPNFSPYLGGRLTSVRRVRLLKGAGRRTNLGRARAPGEK